MSVEPAYMGVWQYEEFTVNITVDPAENEVYSASYTLHFDNTILNATLQTQGPFLRQDGQGSAVPWDVIDNLNGTVEYSEYRQGTDVGVSNPGVLAAITFQVIGDEGISELNLSDYNGELLYSTTGSIPTDVNNGRVGVAQAQTPFLVSGYVFNEDGSDYNNPTANITNLDTGKEWMAETYETSNYYQLTLASCADVIAGEILRFDAASPDGSQNTTEHTVTQDEVNGGGISNFNITLATSAAPTPTLVEYTISNRTITPPQTTEIDVKFSEEVEWKIAIENGGVVHDWTGTSTNPTKKPWNGTYEGTATIVPDGTYVVNITWTNTTTGLGGQNNTETITVSTSIDSNPPAITDVANTTPTTDSVTITWTTDEASDSLVKYGTAPGTYTDSEPTTTMVTSHSITLTGLSMSTTYYFVVNSTDASSNSNESEEHSFTMAAESITSPELISCVITPTPPVAQGTNVSIDCLFSEGVDYEIRIENATGVLIEEIGSGTAKDPDPKWWNTTTGTPAGTYIVNVTMDNSTSGLSSYDDTNIIEVIAAAEMSTVSIGSDNGSVGDSVNVSIDITDALSIGAMDIRVAYNASILCATNVVNGSMIENLPAPLVAYHIGYVDVNISFATLEAINGDGELFIVTFDIISGDAGDSSILALEAEAYTNDTPPQPVGMVTKNGVVNVTDGAADITPPMVIGNSPTGTDVSITTEVTVTFNEVVNQTSAEGAFSIMPGVAGAFSWSGDIMTFTTAADLADNTTYDVTISTDAKDLAGNPLAEPFTWNFTTATVVPSSTTVSIEDVSATGMITVPITIENVSNVGSCQLTLSYDPDVVIVSNASQSDFDSLFTNLDDAASGSVGILAYQTSNPGLDGDVIVAEVTFMTVGNSGSSTTLDLEVTILTDATPDCNPILHAIRDGSFTTFLNGDVSGDGMVDVADCMYLAKHLLGVSGFETIVKDTADVNGNGEIEASDCMYLAKHLAGIDGFEVLK